MTFREDQERHVVPRWRSVNDTIAAGEFQRLAAPRALEPDHEAELLRFEHAWTQAPSTASAADLLGAALVAGKLDLGAAPAAYIATHVESGSVRRMADRLLTNFDATTDADVLDQHYALASQNHFREWIGRQKQRLIADPRNALGWASLARRYTALGQFRQASEAMDLAISLAPNSRYLMRVFTRFSVHIDEPDRAIHMLKHSSRTAGDPWLQAAYLSALAVGSEKVPSLRGARRLISDENFRLIERSELASEVGTLEMISGSDRRTRQLFELSMADPTDNSLAQVEWASHRLPSLESPVGHLGVPFDAEAKAQAAVQKGKWEEALLHARNWQLDQPFDSEAAVLGSYVALTGLENWESGKAFCEMGLLAQPGHPMLTNNLAYALIELGDYGAARAELQRAAARPRDMLSDIALEATRGLLAFRTGDSEEGRLRYGSAIDLAKRKSDPTHQAMAQAMLLREEFASGEWARIRSIVEDLDSVRSVLTDRGVIECMRRSLDLLRSTDS